MPCGWVNGMVTPSDDDALRPFVGGSIYTGAMVAASQWSAELLAASVPYYARAQPQGRMDLFGAAHITMLVLTLVLSVFVVWGARQIRGTPAALRLTRAVGWVLLVVSLGWMVWWCLPQNWVLEQSLPIHLSDVLRLITAAALIWRPRWAIAVSYYWGLTLNLQSIITADLNYFSYPALEFTMYWFLHIGVFLAPLVLVFGLGHRPTWAGYGVALAVTLGWAAAAFLINSFTGANYGYLNGPPDGVSLLDALGPWPLYLLWEAVLIAGFWALMTVPWSLSGGDRATRGSGALRRGPSSS